MFNKYKLVFLLIIIEKKLIMAKNNETEVQVNSINIIGNGTSIVGDIQGEGDIRVDGNLKGTLLTKGRVVVGTTGVFSGEITCKNADISGKVEGKIKVSELLSLKSSSKFSGDIITNKLAIEPNALFTGTCNMAGNQIQHGIGKPQIVEQKETVK